MIEDNGGSSSVPMAAKRLVPGTDDYDIRVHALVTLKVIQYAGQWHFFSSIM